jgi:hypothetical protein
METTKKTLLDYLLELKELNEKTPQEPTFTSKISGFNYMKPLLGPELLETDIIQKYLLSLEEFKNVKKINVLKMPTILVDKDTNIPLHMDPDNLGNTENSKSYMLPSYAYRPYDNEREGKVLIELAEEIDLYLIDLTPPIYDPNALSTSSLGPGVWTMPVIFSPENLQPLKEIKVVYSPESLQDILFDKKPEEVEEILKERIINKVREALNTWKPNVPVLRDIIFRCTERSIKQTVEQK